MPPRLIRWVGDPSLHDDPVMAKNLAQQRLPAGLVLRLAHYDRRQRVSAMPGRSEVTYGPIHGFSRTYTFGPRQFSVWMDEEDARRLLSNEWERWQFLDITHAPDQANPQRAPLTGAEWQSLLASFEKLTDKRRLKAQFRP